MLRQGKVDEYIKTIYMLSGRGRVRCIDIATELNVKKPTVSVSLKELEQEGYIRRLGDRSVVLTDRGLSIAREVIERNAGIYNQLYSQLCE